VDISSAFKSEIFRPLATIVVPGFLALAPYVVVLGYYVPAVPQFWNDHDGAFITVFSVAVLAAGLILEGLGALIETKVLDGSLGRSNPAHAMEWDQYLQLRIKDEMIAQRYLRTVLVHLKFELAMIPAIVSLWSGLLWINCIHSVWSRWGVSFVSLFLLAVVIYLVWESFQSAATLAKTRKLILEATRAMPAHEAAV
jgi:hypothetical protein